MFAGVSHVLGGVCIAITVAVCWYVWTIVPMLVGQTVFEDFRIVAGAVAIALALTVADGVMTRIEGSWLANASQTHEPKQASDNDVT